MMTLDYRFVIEMFSDAGASLGQFPVEVDWEPAREFTRLLALRGGRADRGGNGAAVVIEPVWDEPLAEPHAAGARVVDGEVVCPVSRAYFKSLAVELSGALVEKNILKSGELFRFKLLAFRHTREPLPRNAFTVEDVTPPLPFIETPLAELQRDTVPFADGNREDLPVFIPQRVLDEVEALTLEANTLETGGILIGQLHRDAKMPEIALVVTAQIPAQHTLSKSTVLTFTAETWTAVQAALDLRKSAEIMCGWWHSHPSFTFCKAECPPERRKECSLQQPFLSSDDLLLHRTVFPKAWSVALLANNADAGLGFALFGWRGGIVQNRGFNVSENASPLSNETHTGAQAHASPCPK